MMSFLFDKMKNAVADVGDKIKTNTALKPVHSHEHKSNECSDSDSHHLHRYQSFAPQREGNEVKWYVDGCSYMWAVSMALEQAQREIWILDWWLSPELYLRRPPAKNERYRLDKLLFAAANRGVQVNVIVYKEVTQALTLSSSHTKHWLEDNDKTGNIKVFRHPDHLPDRTTLASSFISSIKQSGLSASKLAQLPGDAIKGIYGMNDGTVLYWAHHEKLCLIDGHVAFMGGLDLCYGRWDTNQHSIADAHPGDLNEIVFPGQDYNNARIMDFSDVQHWEANKLDRKFNSRMGWSDVALCAKGPIVEDLKAHFVQRWNFIYYDKYDVRQDARYKPLVYAPVRAGIIGHPYPSGDDDSDVQGEGQYHGFRERMRQQYEHGKACLEEGRDQLVEQFAGTYQNYPSGPLGGTHAQITRSCAKWSHGVALEHSIANAYIDIIGRSEHFVYMENQFFITATGDQQSPIKNRVGAAIVERALRAARNNEDWHIIINIPAVPAFAGDLKADDSLGTRAIMEFQYFSINRGGHSIMECIAQEGVDPMQYVRFYNLRSYDRINISAAMANVEQKAGVSYDEARMGHDQQYGREYGEAGPQGQPDAYNRYQEAAHQAYGDSPSELASGRWDSVAECYMLNGPDIRSAPWDGDAETEMDAFVSEELYIHSKLLIADDRIVICGSANMNDRSQLGYHDSEIAMIIEDPIKVQSTMADRPWEASLFAASLRRQIFRKHLGLLPVQDYQRPDQNFTPVGNPNVYDWGSREDAAVADPASRSFRDMWNTTARTNTEAFAKVFHPVPDDKVQNWKQYDEYYSRFFKAEDAKKEGQDQQRPSSWKWGHVVREEFSPGQQGVDEMKEILSRVKGNLVEMPLLFLKEEDIAKEGLGLNALTEEVYT
ncbi:Phospholipase D1 [Fulvia fulva]|uniref:Phospholipase n=1 Tax=Passalora fulva TaxID=5499 RepID=A0A9Q8L9C1_PASFU|nr:Phospholipase D1 [Fulvia fulva]KAK4631613.1 Phospholipase D1 [Fulvia fulva]KAK4633479.1 Phospholipase D1 [Fulvia fulva]UJO13326.1 Phospholipase D1 [Fulvia fulva]WPV10454.1 Phospholipase D1 [Fulvia fulva]WPV25545.1 Phospholipase D1 [Fulvia fulva]